MGEKEDTSRTVESSFGLRSHLYGHADPADEWSPSRNSGGNTKITKQDIRGRDARWRVMETINGYGYPNSNNQR
jgi:hypothetical protein